LTLQILSQAFARLEPVDFWVNIRNLRLKNPNIKERNFEGVYRGQ
jgi:hypothetical protein